MTYVLLKENQIDQVGLPDSGVLSDGRGVSGYAHLDPEILHQEGWRKVKDQGEPQHDANFYVADRTLEYRADLDEVRAAYTIRPRPAYLTVDTDVITANGQSTSVVTYRDANEGAPNPVTFLVNGEKVVVALTGNEAHVGVTSSVPRTIVVSVATAENTVTITAE